MSAEPKRSPLSSPKTGLIAALSSPLRAEGSISPSLRLLTVIALAGVALLLPSAARAGQARLPAGTFGAAGSTVPNPYPLDSFTKRIAVDQNSHDVYVADSANLRVEKFDSSGNLLLMFGREVNKTKTEAAAPEAERNLCVIASGDVCQVGKVSSAPGGFETGEFGFQGQLQIAVDNSTGPSAGDVYVSETGKGRNEVQIPTVKNATGGTFKLTFEGQTTAPIAYNAEPHAVQEALESLATIGSGNVAVNVPAVENSPSSVSRTEFFVEFVGALSTTNQTLITADSSGLSAGAEVSVGQPIGNGNGEGAPGALPNVSKFGPQGNLLPNWGNGGSGQEIDGTPNGQLNGANASVPVAGPFGAIEGIAVDPAGNLWVYTSPFRFAGGGNRSVAYGFRQDGSFLTDWRAPRNANLEIVAGEAGIAVDAEDNFYIGPGIEKVTSAGLDLGHLVSNGVTATSLVIDPSSGDLYAGVNVEGSPLINRYESTCQPVKRSGEASCEPSQSFGAGLIGSQASGLALDPSTSAAPLYALVSRGQKEVLTFAGLTVPDPVTAKASGFASGSATLNGTVDPSGLPVTECFFEWGETTAYGHTAECVPSAATLGPGNSPVAVHAQITGLQPGHAYHFRLTAANANDSNGQIDQPEHGHDIAFGPPAIESAAALSAAATSVDLQAVVNPTNVDTRIRIEYGTEPGVYDHITPEVDIGAAGTPQVTAFPLTGLGPSTIYHYRVKAESALAQGLEAVFSGDHTFTTQTPGAVALPDHRGWELVSPPDKHGALLLPIFQIGVTQAAVDGDAIAYLATASTETDPQGNAIKSPILSARGSAGWASRDIAAPHSATTGINALSDAYEYHFFSSDLSHALLYPLGAFEPSLSPQATQQTLFLRSDFPAGEPGSFCNTSCYQPLLAACPEAGELCPAAVEAAANVPAGTEFGEDRECTPAALRQVARCGPAFLGASPDLTHVILGSISPLIPGAPSGAAGVGIPYEYSADRSPSEQLQLLAVRPNGAPIPVSARPTLGSPGTVGRNAISADGSRVVFSEAATSHHLYLRYNADQAQSAIEAGRCSEPELACTLQLDLKTSGSGTGPVEPFFQAASADGSVLFFTDTQRLTADAGAESGKPDLYECKVITGEEGELKCELSDLTPANGSESAAVQGTVLGTSVNGSSVYFVAQGVLTHVPNSLGESASPGRNLYLSHAGQTTFIAGLSTEDDANWREDLARSTSRVSPDGHWLAFMSQQSLTGYDNHDAVTAEPDQEVYLYRAPTAGEEGELLCASCNPTGARPHGVKYDDGGGGQLVSFNLGFQTPVAASVPGWTVAGGEGSLHQPRYLSNGGRLFFNASDALSPSDSNGTEDVYQYEPPQGEGAPAGDICTEALPSYSPVSGGCINLISSGTSSEESAFLDASESGEDVFFLTQAQLSHRDTDTSRDIYDASVGGGEPEAAKPVECEGDGCQRPAVPPNDATPGSLTFNGAGNLHEAKAKKKHKKQHKKRAIKESHKKRAASHNRGGQK